MHDYSPLLITQIPEEERSEFKKLILTTRKQIILPATEMVKNVVNQDHLFNQMLKKQKVSSAITYLRESVWQEFLIQEAEFNASVMEQVSTSFGFPSEALDHLIEQLAINDPTNIKEMCGRYAGIIYPYIYELSLSNTQSRRSRAGSTFEAIIYQIYDFMGYPYECQKQIGRKIFADAGLGKKVDSVLPSIDYFSHRRGKAIIGTMKTTLRERWQEVAEEIDRTKIPEIHLLTVDTNIATNKAKEMAKHNIVVVALEEVAKSESLKDESNIISFEDYLFEEIPDKKKHW